MEVCGLGAPGHGCDFAFAVGVGDGFWPWSAYLDEDVAVEDREGFAVYEAIDEEDAKVEAIVRTCIYASVGFMAVVGAAEDDAIDLIADFGREGEKSRVRIRSI